MDMYLFWLVLAGAAGTGVFVALMAFVEVTSRREAIERTALTVLLVIACAVFASLAGGAR